MTSPAHASRRDSARKRKSSSARKGKLGSDLLSLETEVLIRTCEAVDTPRSLAVSIMARYGEWEQYLSLPFSDASRPDFADNYLVTEMMTKNPRLPIEVDRKQVAISKFLESEQACSDTNARFRLYHEQPASHHKELHWISQCQRILSDALGPLSRGKLESLADRFRFGPGSTSSVNGKLVLASRKYTSRLDVTPRLAPFIRSVVGRMTGELTITRHSKVTTVPKNAKTDRTICIEPHGNIYFQLGVGDLLRGCLTRLGLDPNNQERNRFFARTAVKADYATIDLSAASDTIASAVVEALLPPDWFWLLYLGRTDEVANPDREAGPATLPLEKFSSMGNGFTWELESLIFYAVVRSLTDEDIAVFGDDLVVPSCIVPELIERLEFFGFKTNSRKSFWQGDFRESCGTDWWRDLDVRPFYLRKDSADAYSVQYYAVHVANAVRYYAHRRGGRVFCDRRFLPLWLFLKRKCGEFERTYVSFGVSDAGLVRNWDEARPSRLGHGYCGYNGVVARRPSKESRYTCALGAYLAALDRGTEGRSSLTMKRGRLKSSHVTTLVESMRGVLLAPRTETVPVFDWYDLGPWL